MWLWIREAGRKEQLGRPSFIKTSLCLLPLLALVPAQTLANAQIKAYAEMICGTNLKTAKTEEPEIKKRCMSGLIKLGKKHSAFLEAAFNDIKIKQTFSAASVDTPPMQVDWQEQHANML